MIVTEFSETCQLYTDFQIWEIATIDEFFKGNEILSTIFFDHYKIDVKELKERRKEIKDSDMDIITKLLSFVDNKSFFIFTLHNENHLELVKMQQLKIMNFGVNIEEVKGNCVYVVIMDKKK